MNNDWKKETICVQGGWNPGNGEARVLPIYQSTTFLYENSEEMGKLFDLEAEGYFYSRLANPTCDTVAAKIAALEGGIGAVLTSSGMSANYYAVFNICENGDHIVASSTIYGGSYNLFSTTMKKQGIEVTFVNQDDNIEELEKAFRPNTKLVFAESVSNPTVKVLDIEKFAKLAHSHNVPFIIDNTFATPINCRPFEWGADIITHSTTKYMDGHASTMGGCIVDSGHFNWLAYGDKYAGLTQPDESYHGIIYAEKFGKMGYIQKIVAQLMRDMGSCQAPMNAFLLNLGLESLHLRMKRHCENAEIIAEYLSKHPKIAWVNYPTLKDSIYYDSYKKYMPEGVCGVMSFGLKGSARDTVDFMDRLKIIRIVTHVADARSCILHPASHTQRQLTEEQLREQGVDPSMIRLSIGIENVDDLIGDLAASLDMVTSI